MADATPFQPDVSATARRVPRESGRPGSNRRHPAWKAGALPTELHPRPVSVAPCIRTRGRGTRGPCRRPFSPLRTSSASVGTPAPWWGSRVASSVRWRFSSRSSVTPVHTLGMHYLLTVHLLQNVVLAEWAPLLVVLGIHPALAVTVTRPSVTRALTHPAVAPRSGSRTTCSGTSRGSTTPRSSIRARCSTSSTPATATGRPLCGGASSRTRCTGWGQDPGWYTFAAFVLGSPIGLVMALVPDAIYDFYVAAHHRVWGSRCRRPAARRDPDGARAGRPLLRRLRVLVPALPRGGGPPRRSRRHLRSSARRRSTRERSTLRAGAQSSGQSGGLL